MHQNIRGFLTQDIQGGIYGCEKMLEIVRSIAEREQSELCSTGNAHTVTIKPDAVTIECIWDEGLGIAELSVDDFKECLNEWHAFISS
jgi:hypothetical protein